VRTYLTNPPAIVRTPPTWRRCGGCGRLVKVPADPRGRACRKCGEPLSSAREP
jgi:hypothetical protein